MSSIFTKIINREVEGQFVYEDEICVVLMDKFPAIDGQTLVIPRLELDYVFDLPDKIYEHLFKVAKKIALASDKAFQTRRSCLIVEGFEVPHVHIKIYPITQNVENIKQILRNRKNPDNNLLAEQADLIKKHLN